MHLALAAPASQQRSTSVAMELTIVVGAGRERRGTSGVPAGHAGEAAAAGDGAGGHGGGGGAAGERRGGGGGLGGGGGGEGAGGEADRS